MAMTLGTYLFEWDPDRYTIPRQKRSCAVAQTYTSNAFFSWGNLLDEKIVLEWDWMSYAQWQALESAYLGDVEVYWDDGHSIAYNVEVVDLDGEYFEVAGPDLAYRRNVKLTLLLVETTTYTGAGATTTTTAP